MQSQIFTTPQELKTRMHEVVLLDVRTPEEFAAAHMDGARLVPLDQLDERTVRELGQSGKECVVICRSGRRAQHAARKLLAAGVRASVLEGGMTAWEAQGGEVQREGKKFSLGHVLRIVALSLVPTGAILGAVMDPGFFALSAFAGLLLLGGCGMSPCLMGPALAGASCRKNSSNCREGSRAR